MMMRALFLLVALVCAQQLDTPPRMVVEKVVSDKPSEEPKRFLTAAEMARKLVRRGLMKHDGFISESDNVNSRNWNARLQHAEQKWLVRHKGTTLKNVDVFRMWDLCINTEESVSRTNMDALLSVCAPRDKEAPGMLRDVQREMERMPLSDVPVPIVSPASLAFNVRMRTLRAHEVSLIARRYLKLPESRAQLQKQFEEWTRQRAPTKDEKVSMRRVGGKLPREYSTLLRMSGRPLESEVKWGVVQLVATKLMRVLVLEYQQIEALPCGDSARRCRAIKQRRSANNLSLFARLSIFVSQSYALFAICPDNSVPRGTCNFFYKYYRGVRILAMLHFPGVARQIHTVANHINWPLRRFEWVDSSFETGPFMKFLNERLLREFRSQHISKTAFFRISLATVTSFVTDALRAFRKRVSRRQLGRVWSRLAFVVTFSSSQCLYRGCDFFWSNYTTYVEAPRLVAFEDMALSILHPTRFRKYWGTGVAVFSLLLLLSLTLAVMSVVSGALKNTDNAVASAGVLVGLVVITTARLVYWIVQPRVFVSPSGLNDFSGAISRFFQSLVPLLFFLMLLLFSYMWFEGISSVLSSSSSAHRSKVLAWLTVLVGVVSCVLGLTFGIGAVVYMSRGEAGADGGTWDSPNAFIAGNWVLEPVHVGLCVLLSALLLGYSLYARRLMTQAEGVQGQHFSSQQRRSAIVQALLYALMLVAFVLQFIVLVYGLSSSKHLPIAFETYIAGMLTEAIVCGVIMIIMFFSLGLHSRLRARMELKEAKAEAAQSLLQNESVVPDQYDL